jgi:hypothetical protein
VINAIEQQQDLTVTGSSTHLAAARRLSSPSTTDLTAVVSASGWQIGVPAADFRPGRRRYDGQRQRKGWGNTVAAEHPIELDLNAGGGHH